MKEAAEEREAGKGRKDLLQKNKEDVERGKRCNCSYVKQMKNGGVIFLAEARRKMYVGSDGPEASVRGRGLFPSSKWKIIRYLEVME